MASPLKTATRKGSNYNPTGRITENLNNDTAKNRDLNAKLNQANYEKYQVIGKQENVGPSLSSIQSLLNLATEGVPETNGCDLWIWSPDMNVGVPTPEMYKNSKIANRYKLAFSHKTHIRNQESVAELKINDVLSGMCANINSLNDFVPLEMFAGSVAANVQNELSAKEAMAQGALVPVTIAKELDASKVGVSDTAPVSNDFAYFVEPCKSSTITSPWGIRTHPIKNVLQMHQGMDTGTPANSVLYATYDGVVSFVRPTTPTQMGEISITHTINYVLPNKKITLQNDLNDSEDVDLVPGTYKSVYYHVYKVDDSLKNGQMVKTGQVIGTSGGEKNMNGANGSTGAHLHYELRYLNNGKNKSFNPFQVLAWGSAMQGNRAATTKEKEQEKLYALQQRQVADAARKQQEELIARDTTTLLSDATIALASGDIETSKKMVQALIEKNNKNPLNLASSIALKGLRTSVGL